MGLTIVLVMFSMAMGVILEINQNFPFQVALSFDEAAMDVLDWLEDCDFEWTCMSIFRRTPCGTTTTRFECGKVQ